MTNVSGYMGQFAGPVPNAFVESRDLLAAPVRVVIVDAHVRLLDTMARLLAASPWIEVIGTASSAAEGARVVRKWRPDVVLTDYRLPDVAGLDAIRLFKGFDRRTKVVVLSVSERADVKDAAHKAGVSAWVWKGGSLDQIIEAVLRVHGGSH